MRCLPPENRPTAAELAACRPFLSRVIERLPRTAALLAIGKVAHDSAVRVAGVPLRSLSFAHGREHMLPDGRTLIDSYHCSRYNVNTGRLTEAMFDAVVGRAAQLAGITARAVQSARE